MAWCTSSIRSIVVSLLLVGCHTRSTVAIAAGGGVTLESGTTSGIQSSFEAGVAGERDVNYPMYICNSICAQCANGEIVFIRRAMSWKHFVVRAGFEATVGSLSTVTRVSGLGTVVSYGLTAASEATARRMDVSSLPNECHAVTVLRASERLNLNNSSAAYDINVAELDGASYEAFPELQLYRKNMNVIAQKEKDSRKGLGWLDWGKRMVGVEQVYEKPGAVPKLIETITARYFCGGKARGLMEARRGSVAIGDNLTKIRYVPISINGTAVLSEADGGFLVNTSALGKQNGLAYRLSMDLGDIDSSGDGVDNGRVIHDGFVIDNAWLQVEVLPAVIKQESTWRSFRRNVKTAGGLGKNTGDARMQAMGQCHIVADQAGLGPTDAERREDEAAAAAFEADQELDAGRAASRAADATPGRVTPGRVTLSSGTESKNQTRKVSLIRRQIAR